ncbi:MAG TPA: hypothetical protein DDZ89_01770 [Clostridiales bacterium]|nr:hypothetical protein [Clostridiales bacterium]
MANIANADPNALVILSAIISSIISNSRDPDELETIANFLTAVADLINLRVGQLSHQEDAKKMKQQITDLENQLCELKKKYY